MPSTPEAGAECVNAHARICAAGRWATSAPTATVTLSKELPDFIPPLFNAVATASALGEADRYAVLWARLQRADERFSEAWFENAYKSMNEYSGPQFSLALQWVAISRRLT